MKTNEEQNQKPPNYTFRATVVLVLGTLFAILSPTIFTRNAWLFSFYDTGEIGDTIGGLTAPFIGVMGAILLYLTLIAQVKANKLQQDQIDDQRDESLKQKEFDNLFSIYRQIADDLDSASFIRTETFHGSIEAAIAGNVQSNTITYTGRPAIKRTLIDISQRDCFSKTPFEAFNNSNEIEWITDCMEITKLLLNRIDEARIEPFDKQTLTLLIKHLFYSRLAKQVPVSHHIRCEREHPLFPDEFTEMIRTLDRMLQAGSMKNYQPIL